MSLFFFFWSLQRIHRYWIKYQEANYDLSAADFLVCLIVRQLFYLIAYFFGGLSFTVVNLWSCLKWATLKVFLI